MTSGHRKMRKESIQKLLLGYIKMDIYRVYVCVCVCVCVTVSTAQRVI
jgi:hypothetical protein